MTAALVSGVRGAGAFHRNARLYLWYSLGFGLYWSMASLGVNLLLRAEGLANDAIGQVDTLMAVGSLALGLTIGVGSERVGHRLALVAGAAAAPVALLGLALAPPGPLQGAAAVVFGAAQVSYYSVGYAHMAENSREEERVSLFSLSTFLVYATGFGGFMLAGIIPALAQAAGAGPSDGVTALRLMLVVAAAVAALAALPLLRLGPAAYPGELAPGGRRPKPAYGMFARFLVPHLVLGFGAGAMVLFFQLFFRQRFGLEPPVIGVILGTAQLATAAGALLSPVVARRTGPVTAILLLQASSMPFLAVVAYAPALPAVVVAYYVRAVLMNMGEPIYATFAMEQVPATQRATLAGLDQGAWTIGYLFGPLASGAVQVRSGFGAAFTITLVCYVVAEVLFAAFFLPGARRGRWRHAGAAPPRPWQAH